MTTRPKLAIEYVREDSFNVVPGSGWVITKNGKRLDWPMLTTRAEAEADLRDFKRVIGELAADEISEAAGLARMSGL